MITKTTMWGLSGEKLKKTGESIMESKDALRSIVMDLDKGYKAIKISDTCIVMEYYDEPRFKRCLHEHYEGPKKQMVRLVNRVRAMEAMIEAAA